MLVKGDYAMQNKPVEIAEGIYWVGANIRESGLVCNPYLIVAGEEAVLVDPGSPLDFDKVYDNVRQLVPLERIKYIILQHQDPDFCASTPLFEQKGVTAAIATHWRTAQLVKYYGIKSPFYIINQHKNKLQLNNGRVLQFIATPYLHYPGAITTYDQQTKTLFSSDLFGAYSYYWSLFADELPDMNGKDMYLEVMKTFHEHYMPANSILRPVMEKFLQLDIQTIAPQHGSIIRKNIPVYIKELRDLECGSLLKPIKKEMAKSAGMESICNEVLHRLFVSFSKEEVMQAFSGSDILLDSETCSIVDYSSTSRDLWQNIFRIIAAQKGWLWLAVIEPLVTKLVYEYDVEMPEVFSSSLQAMEKQTYELTAENRQLKSVNERLEHSLDHANETLLKCPVTGLYNQSVLMRYLQEEEVVAAAEGDLTSVLLVLSVDNLAALNIKYGNQIGDEILKAVAYILTEIAEENHKVFKAGGASFAYYIGDTNQSAAIAIAETIRVTIERSTVTVEPITVSIGVGLLGEFIGSQQSTEEQVELLFFSVQSRMQIARERGQNQVCFDSEAGALIASKGKVLIADYELSSIELIKTALEQEQYEVFVATDGERAYDLVGLHAPDVVITELMLPKLDAFLVKEKTRMLSISKDIPFILLSHQKDLASIQRAMSLGIEHYLSKPYYLSEVVGIVNNKTKAARMKHGS